MLTESEKRELRNLLLWAFYVTSDELFIEFQEEFYNCSDYVRLEKLREKATAEEIDKLYE